MITQCFPTVCYNSCQKIHEEKEDLLMKNYYFDVQELVQKFALMSGVILVTMWTNLLRLYVQAVHRLQLLRAKM